MRKHLLLLLTVILSTNCYSQISYEKGYFINNQEEKIECLIKNIDWKNNPIQFQYKLSENSEPKKGVIKLVKGFEIYNSSKYVRKSVDIDRSSAYLDHLSPKRNPIFNKEELFLKVLVEGKISLYQYKDESLLRFFFNKANENDTQQLIFKSYKLSERLIKENNTFKQQLINHLKCEEINPKEILAISYRKQDLLNLFLRYNKSSNSIFINFEAKQKSDLFHLNIRPRLNRSSLMLEGPSTYYEQADFENKIRLGFGLEAEFILPFNKNKWAVILESDYQHFKSEKELVTRTAKVDSKSVHLNIGIRHYFFLNDKAKIFVNGSVIHNIPINSKIDFNYNYELEITNGQNFGIGIGYKQNDKYSLEIRHHTTRRLLGSYLDWLTEYKTLSVIFGYSIF